MLIHKTLWIIGAIIFISGVVASTAITVKFHSRFRKSSPESYKSWASIWKESQVIKEAVRKTGDRALQRMYDLSIQVPIASAICFGLFIIVFILIRAISF